MKDASANDPLLEQREQQDDPVPQERSGAAPAGRGRPAQTFPYAALASETVAQGHAADTGLGSEETAGYTPKADDADMPVVQGYQLLGELGRGGMGIVYKARQLNLKRIVALKMIRAGAQADPAELARFRSEAEAVARLQHANIVQIHDIGEQGSLSYFSLEFVEGGSLAHRLAAAPLTPADGARLVATLARAVDHAHQRGIIHRDLKPANVLLTADGTPKVADFGLAKQLAEDSGQTRTGAILGTPCYMAPEQAAGRSNTISPATDVYALGAILYELLTGRPPFRGPTVLETLEQVRTQEPIIPSKVRPGVPRDLETICLQCLQKEPGQRYPSALALANDLDRFCASEPILARRERLPARLVRHVRRHPRIALASLAVAAIMAVAIAATLYAWTAEQGAERQQVVLRLQGEVLACLDRLDGLAGHVAEAEGRIRTLEELAPEVATEERERLLQRLQEWVRGQIRQALDDERLARIHKGIALVEQRDRARAGALEKELADRQGRWDPVVQLSAPVSARDSVFVPERAVVSGLPGDPRDLVVTRQSCGANVELRAVFAYPSWESASHLGVVLNAVGPAGYTFLLTGSGPPGPGKAATATLGGVHAGSGLFHLKILRKGVPLRQRTFTAREVPTGPLEIWARREGGRLTCQINNLKALEYEDPFPLGSAHRGAFGVVWPTGVSLQTLVASQQALAVSPDPLELGDDLYDRGLYREAQEHYRKHALAAAAGPRLEQVRYKEALCLLRLQREEEGRALLEEVAAGKGRRWPFLADCQLLVLLLSRNKDARQSGDADAVLERLKGRGLGAAEVARLLPDDVRDRLTDTVLAPGRLGVLQSDAEALLGEHRRILEFKRLLQPDLSDPWVLTSHAGTTMALMYLCRLTGREDEALSLSRDILKHYPALDFTDYPRQFLVQVCWILRRRGQAAEALRELEPWLSPPPGLQVPPALIRPLFLEQARNHAALERWSEAERDLEHVLPSGTPPAQVSLGPALSALLLKGFLLEQRGDLAGARRAWQQGAAQFATENDEGSMTTVVHALILASLSEQPLAVDVPRLMNRLLNGSGGDERAGRLAETIAAQVPPAALLEMWRTPRGRALARKLAFLDLSYADVSRLPIVLLVAETLHQRAFPPGPLSPEQDLLLQDLVQSTLTAYANKTLGVDQMLQLGFTWKGTTTLLWRAQKSGLAPELRGPFAYVFGHRFERLNHLREARAFFQEALDAAPAASALQRLARAELKRLVTK